MNEKEIRDQLEDIEERIQELETNKNTDEIDNEIDDLYPPIDIMGLTYLSSYVLNLIDKTAYRGFQLNYNDKELTALEEEKTELEQELKIIKDSQ